MFLFQSKMWGQSDFLIAPRVIEGNTELVEEKLAEKPIIWLHQTFDVWQVVGRWPDHQMANVLGRVQGVDDHLQNSIILCYQI